MTVKLNSAKAPTQAAEPEIKVADAQATLDVQNNVDAQASIDAQENVKQENVTITEQVNTTEQVTDETPFDMDSFEPFEGRERVPSDWDIREEGDDLVFTNTVTQRRIVGITVKQFGMLMKG